MSRKLWTEEEISILREGWGTKSKESLYKKLGRTPSAVKVKAHKLKLGRYLSGGDYITMGELLETVVGYRTSKLYRLWIDKNNLPITYKKINTRRCIVVKIEDFWEWASDNRDKINWVFFTPNSLGEEPLWVATHRKNYAKSKVKYKANAWTSDEISKLTTMINQHRYTYQQLSHIFHRTANAIAHKCIQLNLKSRPNREKQKNWTHEEVEVLIKLTNKGYSYNMMSEELNRSSLSIRAKMKRLYGYGNLDEVRRKINESIHAVS